MAPNAGTIKTRVCIISDTHNARLSDHHPFFRSPLPTADVLLHAGDLTMTGRFSELQQAVDMIAAADAPLKIVIPGNHDITLDEPYYKERSFQHGPKRNEDTAACKSLFVGQRARDAGIVYMEEGTRTFELKNGAKLTVYASAYQPEFCNWAFGYPRLDEDRFNPAAVSPKDSSAGKKAPANPIPTDGIDVMITHGPPQRILDEVQVRGISEPVGCEHLRRAVERVRPRMHCFGHIHEGYGAVHMDWTSGASESFGLQDEDTVREQRCRFIDRSNVTVEEAGKSTLFVNASIMNVHYKPANAPWVVDLVLPAASQ